ncbi:hypothetical protein K402DRAFT_128868 [Aulographum hederae CBS 113979]|uniref:Uncharacterized protein n=1 Tax=Aulographum hederae CBS 113979 TaxID=1176131 RepID=A0A6G1HED0_9PEZI|nr:hypothetical protein K402DRAFT_128868 [Aulographum hederae CBS 113979]
MASLMKADGRQKKESWVQDRLRDGSDSSERRGKDAAFQALCYYGVLRTRRFAIDARGKGREERQSVSLCWGDTNQRVARIIGGCLERCLKMLEEGKGCGRLPLIGVFTDVVQFSRNTCPLFAPLTAMFALARREVACWVWCWALCVCTSSSSILIIIEAGWCLPHGGGNQMLPASGAVGARHKE